jgi:hypothetical protein
MYIPINDKWWITLNRKGCDLMPLSFMVLLHAWNLMEEQAHMRFINKMKNGGGINLESSLVILPLIHPVLDVT